FTGGTVYRNQAYAGCIHQPGTMSYVYNNSVNDPIYAGDYAETVVAPTYTEQGYTLHVCPCGDSYKDNYTDRLLLPAVKNLAVAGKTDSSVTLRWAANTNADGYIIEKSNGSAWERIITVKNNSTTTYKVTGLDKATEYRFRVTPYVMPESAVLRGNAAEITAKTAPTELNGLQAVAATNGTAIRLAWEKNSTATGYIIDKLVDGSWVNVVTIENNSSVSYTVSGLDSSTAYRFRVTPYTTLSGNIIKAAGVSVSGKTAPAAISGLEVSKTTADSITLSWEKNTTSSGYVIEMLVGNSWESVVTVKSSSTTGYTVTGLSSSTSYRFRVTPFTTFGDSTIRGTGASVTGRTL
ncbi:MAG: fibronectin type III domain-containing protein, partial [Ruminiclostridium sp.]|nr:fibronectin type III domain-containing protein [Ruminiclostridium sp.]